MPKCTVSHYASVRASPEITGDRRSVCDRCRSQGLSCKLGSDALRCHRCVDANVKCVMGFALKFASRQRLYRDPSVQNKQYSTLHHVSLDNWQTGDDQLCERCSGIDIEKALQVPRHYTGRFIMALGKVCEDMRNSACPLCRLFATVHVELKLRPRPGGDVHQLRAFRGHTMVGLRAEGSEEFDVALGICQGLADRTSDGKERLRCLFRGFIAPVLPQPARPRAFQVQLVKRKEADMLQLRDWLQDCQDRHKDACGLQNSSRLIGLKCIDVANRFIVPIEAGEEYFALSYVWGTSKPLALLEKEGNNIRVGKLSGPVKVIEDAMTVVKRLGGRYLWVDQCCINQEDPEEKHTQVKIMDRIYEGATATIIAAPAKDSESGLPGISRPRMEEQAVERIGPYLLASTLPHVSVAVSASIWASRGWTFQEAMLSRRCFYFTDHQVYFVCKGMTCCESIARCPQTDLFSLERSVFRTDALDMKLMAEGKELSGLWQFFENLHHYKSRDLTRDDDSINAFQGLLARSGYKHIWGVPIPVQDSGILEQREKALSIAFARGLWWENPGVNSQESLRKMGKYITFRRREEFPSWSWSGWCGTIRPHVHHGDISSDLGCNQVDEESFDTQIWADVEIEPGISPGSPISLGNLWRRMEDLGNCPKLTKVIYVHATICRVRIRRDFKSTNPIGYVCDCGYYKECNQTHGNSHHKIRFFEDPLKDAHLSGNIFSQFWETVLLFKLKEPGQSTLIAALIIDRHEMPPNCAQVRGVAYFHARTIQRMDKWRETVKIV